MTPPIFALAHPYENDLENLGRAMHWCAVLSREFEALFVAPWVPLCLHWPNEGEPLKRGLYLSFTAIRESRGLILTGGRISTNMARERDFAASLCGKAIIDASRYATPEELLADPAGVELLTGFIERRVAWG